MKYKQIFIILITVMQEILERLNESDQKPRALNSVTQLQQLAEELKSDQEEE